MSATELTSVKEELMVLEDNLFHALNDFAYKFLDRFHYPETDVRARELYKIVSDAQRSLVEPRHHCHGCHAELTSADMGAGECTQCRAKIG